MVEQDVEKSKVDLQTQEMTERFASAEIFEKSAIVDARIATAGEKVITQLADGTVETENTAEEGDVVVTNPGGEEYILKAEKFNSRYSMTEDGRFQAKGMARAFQNNTGQPVEVVAPWGEIQYGDPDCMFATVYDPEQPDLVGTDRYIIGKAEFDSTYRSANLQTALPDASPDTNL